MTLIYSDEELKGDGFKVFLAGPTPRTKEVKSWRPDFISLLEYEGFKGNVFIAENKDGRPYNCKAQTPWEVKNLQSADLVAFWIPRDLEEMPGFTTNIEFGEHMRSGKVVVGFPKEAPSTEYISVRCEMHSIPLFHSTEEVVAYIIDKEKKYLSNCPRCSGSGSVGGLNDRLYTCPTCKGHGHINYNQKLNMKNKLTPFGALIISMTFSIICVIVVLIHIHLNFPNCK